MNRPPKKRLRQSTILDAFNSTTSSTEAESVVQKISENNLSMDSGVRNKITVPAEERRRETSSPVTNKPTTDQTASQSDKDPTHGSTKDSQNLACSTTQSVGDGSGPLFTNSDDCESPRFCADFPSSSDTQPMYKGCSKCELLTKPACGAKLPQLKPAQDHTVLVNFRSRSEAPSPMYPYPSVYVDQWDTDHVRMPCSRENLYPVDGPAGKKELQNRWMLIKSALQAPLSSSYDIEEAILVYNSRYSNKWEFSGLHSFLNETLTKDENRQFFNKVLPKMVKLALDLPEICTQSLPLLKRGSNHSLTMSQYQAASLLANAFFCTYPRRNTRQKSSEYSSFPDINFNDLFSGKNSGKADSRKKEKLRCLLEYFRRVAESMPTGNLTFTRRCIPDSGLPDWATSGRRLPKLRAQSSGTIEDDGYGMLQVDFANKFLGGGVLNSGLVQEEIRFMICPEMILSRLVTEVLDPSECLLMIGCERYSNYTGYGDTFRWKGSHYDPTPRDGWERLCCEVVAIDAVCFFTSDRQYAPAMVKREVNKAYCGFYQRLPKENLSAVATGNWGCGAFRGDPRLKFLIQLMAAAECSRDLCYFTFGDPDLCTDVYDMYTILCDRNICVGDLYALVHQYGRFVETSKNQAGRKAVFRYILDSLLSRQAETDDDNVITDDSSSELSAPTP